jgi:hypothetical protein
MAVSREGRRISVLIRLNKSEGMCDPLQKVQDSGELWIQISETLNIVSLNFGEAEWLR